MESVQFTSAVAPRGTTSPIAAGERIAKKLVDIHDWAQAALASAKDEQERQSNRHRDAAPMVSPGRSRLVGLAELEDRPSLKTA